MTSRKAGESAPKGQRSVLRRIVETLVIVAMVVGLNVLLVYTLYPYGSTSEVVWSEYAAAADQIFPAQPLDGRRQKHRHRDSWLVDGAACHRSKRSR